MFRPIAILITVFALSTNALAGFDGPRATPEVVPVNSISDMNDDTKVTIEGYIVEQISVDHYLFKDDTGDIKVEIEDKIFRGANVTPETQIRLIGDVDRDWKKVSVDVDYLEIVE